MKVRFAPWYSWFLTIAGGFILLTALLVSRPSVVQFVIGPIFLLLGILSFRNPYLEVEDGTLNVRDSFMGKRSFLLSDLDFDSTTGVFHQSSGKKRTKVAWRKNANKKEWEAFIQTYMPGSDAERKT